jgi:hypothetical protein
MARGYSKSTPPNPVNNFHEKTLFNTENFWAGMLQAVGLRLHFNELEKRPTAR